VGAQVNCGGTCHNRAVVGSRVVASNSSIPGPVGSDAVLVGPKLGTLEMQDGAAQ